MSIVVLSDVIVSGDIILAGGASGRSTRQNDRTVNTGGFATANVVRDVTMREYSLGVKPMLTSLWAQVIGLYEITEAGAFGMLLEDPVDAVCSATEGKVTLVNSAYRLFKRYKAAGSTRYLDRQITRPKTPIVIYRNGVAMVSGVTINYDTGTLTITSPGADVFTWSGSFYVPVHFAEDNMEWDLVRPGMVEDRLVMGPSIPLIEVREL